MLLSSSSQLLINIKSARMRNFIKLHLILFLYDCIVFASIQIYSASFLKSKNPFLSCWGMFLNCSASFLKNKNVFLGRWRMFLNRSASFLKNKNVFLSCWGMFLNRSASFLKNKNVFLSCWGMFLNNRTPKQNNFKYLFINILYNFNY